MFLSLKSKVLKDSLSIDLFLHTHTGGSQHSKTSVLKFLGLHGVEVLGICWLEASTESNVTRVICLTKSEERTKAGLNPSSSGTGGLGNVDGEEEWEENSSGNLGDLVVGNGVVNIHSVCDGWCGFTNEVTKSGHHGNTSVHDFGLTETLDSIDILALGEAKRIEKSEWGNGSGKAEAWGRFIGNPVVEGSDELSFGHGGFGNFLNGSNGSGNFLNLGHAESSKLRGGSGRSEGRGASNGSGEDGELHV